MANTRGNYTKIPLLKPFLAILKLKMSLNEGNLSRFPLCEGDSWLLRQSGAGAISAVKRSVSDAES